MNSQIWLMKTEPGVYSIEHLKKDQKTWWEGVRNYQARNFMSKSMKIGDQVVFYHSNAEPSGIAGLATVCSAAKPDPSQFDKKSEYFDPKATLEKPRWFCVQVQFQNKFPQILALSDLKTEKKLKDMMLLKKGQRLSIQPVSEIEFKTICQIGLGQKN